MTTGAVGHWERPDHPRLVLSVRFQPTSRPETYELSRADVDGVRVYCLAPRIFLTLAEDGADLRRAVVLNGVVRDEAIAWI